MLHRVSVRAALVGLAVVVAGCATAKGAYVDGMQHETAGDYGRAADAYATALERDPTLRNVPGRLAVAGREAVREWTARARAAAPPESGLWYRTADALVQRAARLGIDLARPASFEADRDRAYAEAVAALTARAEAARQRGVFSEAIGTLAEAARFDPSPEAQDRIVQIRLDAYADWAEADLGAGRYRDGLAHADAALALAPEDPELRALVDAIRQAGTVVVAILPTEGDDVGTQFLRDLDDLVVEDRLTPAPEFVALVDPVDVRRWDRGQRRRPDVSDSPRRLAEAAADLDADLGVVVALRPIQESTREREPRVESVRPNRGRARVEISLRDVTLTLTARADVLAADRAGRMVCERTVEARATETYDLATTAGDWRDLDLTRRQREAFAGDAPARAADRAYEVLRDRLADALAREVARCVGAQVR